MNNATTPTASADTATATPNEKYFIRPVVSCRSREGGSTRVWERMNQIIARARDGTTCSHRKLAPFQNGEALVYRGSRMIVFIAVLLRGNDDGSYPGKPDQVARNNGRTRNNTERHGQTRACGRRNSERRIPINAIVEGAESNCLVVLYRKGSRKRRRRECIVSVLNRRHRDRPESGGRERAPRKRCWSRNRITYRQSGRRSRRENERRIGRHSVCDHRKCNRLVRRRGKIPHDYNSAAANRECTAAPALSIFTGTSYGQSSAPGSTTALTSGGHYAQSASVGSAATTPVVYPVSGDVGTASVAAISSGTVRKLPTTFPLIRFLVEKLLLVPALVRSILAG